MLKLDLVRDPNSPFRVLALGAHCDDIEIGCGGTLLSLLSAYPNLCFDWVVFTSNPVRAREAQASAERFLRGAKEKRIVLKEFRNGYFPDQWARIKDDFEALKAEVRPDLILTHHAQDLHQDHRTVAELTWSTFRDHAILEYEVPKYDSDLGSPNFFVPLDRATAVEKARILMECFASQRDKHWFTQDTFLALMRLRGVQCAAPGGYAEGFHARKLSAGIRAGRSNAGGE
ncbi:MAG TPA: PIG-L deacetylase family protein [Myxococcota bacterium]|nr:PIG-L deacetylase family protein [Myxococcota bacterium]